MKDSIEVMVAAVIHNPHERAVLPRSCSLAEQSTIVTALSPYVQQQVLRELSIDEIVALVDHMDLLTAQKVLQRIKDPRRRHKIVHRLKTELKEKVDYFLRFHPKATLSLVHFNYVLLSSDSTIATAGDTIDAHYKETGKFPEVLVHAAGELIGEVALATLVRERNSLTLASCVTPVSTIPFHSEVQTIVDVLRTSKRKKIVVLDTDGSVIGIIYADDAIELFGQLPLESLYSFAGVEVSELPFDTGWSKFTHRYRWLIVNLATAFMAGSVVLLFKDTIDRIAILAVYIPIVTGMGGNAASQAFAVVVRGITMGQISLRNGVPAVWNELQSGVYNGLLIGFIVACISVVFHGSVMLGVVVAVAMITVHTVAGVAGAGIPLIMKQLGKDPASVSMIFITTLTDVFGMLSLLGLGALLLG
jgi:magnesium transporter